MTQTLTTKNPKIIDGREIARATLEQLSVRPITDKKLVAVSVGADEAAKSFLKAKERAAETLNINFDHKDLPKTSTVDQIVGLINSLATDNKVGGIILQLPLPRHFTPDDLDCIFSAIPAKKDVDLIGHEAAGRFYNGFSKTSPPAVGAVMKICQSLGISLAKSEVAVIGGGGKLIGRPMAIGLAKEVSKLVLLDKLSTEGMAGTADIVICGAGLEDPIDPSVFKHGCVVIDFGYNKQGDVRKDNTEALKHLKAWTTNPGGTGPVLVAKIIKNFVELTS